MRYVGSSQVRPDRGGCGTRQHCRRYPELTKELVQCREMQAALKHLISEKRSSIMGRLRRAGDALLQELANCQQPLQLRHEFFTDATTVGACVQRVLELPPAAGDGECPRSRFGTAALPAPCANAGGSHECSAAGWLVYNAVLLRPDPAHAVSTAVAPLIVKAFKRNTANNHAGPSSHPKSVESALTIGAVRVAALRALRAT